MVHRDKKKYTRNPLAKQKTLDFWQERVRSRGHVHTLIDCLRVTLLPYHPSS